DLLAGLAMTAEGDQIVGARLRALIADDAGLRAGAGLGLQPEHAAKARRRRPPLRRILERERGLRRVLQRDPQAFQQVDEKDRLQELENHARSPIKVGSVSPDMITRSLRSVVPSLRILSC